MISGGIASLLSPRITEYETQSGKQTQLKWIFMKKVIKIWNLNCLRNLASCGIAHSIGIEKYCGTIRWLNSLKCRKTKNRIKPNNYKSNKNNEMATKYCGKKQIKIY